MAVSRLQDAETLEGAEEAWEDFLTGASKVYEKLRAGARGHNKSWMWFLKKQDERDAEPLLSYVHHARNSDHHRLEEVTERIEAQTFIALPEAKYVGTERHTIFPGTGARIVTMPARVKLVPVIDKGVTYPVPTRFKNAMLDAEQPVTLALVMCFYLGDLISEAHALSR